MRQNAFAKINLGLSILARRPDGFHEIETVFHRIALHDEITLEKSEGLHVVSDDPAAPDGEANICYKAAKLLHGILGADSGAEIRLAKRIPVGAGLGGGSSDAATVLRCLPTLWGLGVGERTLLDLAARLGSDVPYFMHHGSAFARGRGEILEYFDLTIPFAILLCYPGIPISTAWAYSQITPSKGRATDMRRAIESGIAEPERLAKVLTNDFESPVFASHPQIRRIKEAMVRGGAVFALLSGSGSTVYGFFPNDRDAEALSEEFRSTGYRTHITPPNFVPPSDP